MQKSSRVLVLEDDLLILLDLTKMLEENGHKVVSASKSIEEAMSFLDTERPDIALLDIRLGQDSDSFSVAQRLHSMGCPFLFVTAYDQRTLAVPKELEQAPWVSKPFDDSKLRAVLNTVAAE